MNQDSIFFSCTRNFSAKKVNNLHIFYVIEPLVRLIVLFLLIGYFLLINIVPSYGETLLNSKANSEVQNPQKDNSITKVTLFKANIINAALNSDFFNSENGDDDMLAILKYLPVSNLVAQLFFIAYPQNDLAKQYLSAYTHLSFFGKNIYLRQRVLRI